MVKIVKNLPKIDLHCHLDGSLSRECIQELLGRSVDERELQVDSRCRSLAEYLEKFDIPLQCMQTEKGLKAAAYDFMQSMSKDHICYVEVRFAPLLSAREGLDCRRVIEAALEGFNRGREEFGIEYGVIVCAMRNHSEEENLGMIKTAMEYLGAGVCAADLAGDEAAYPTSRFRTLFREVKKWGMPFTIHAGECGSVEDVVEAVSCGAGRIGHGIALQNHPDAMRLCRDRGIGIEMCPTSNGQTKAVTDFSTYPMREFLEEGLLVTINTDNRTVSNTTIEKEIRFVQEKCKVTDREILQMMKNAARVSFASDDVKHRLLQHGLR